MQEKVVEEGGLSERQVVLLERSRQRRRKCTSSECSTSCVSEAPFGMLKPVSSMLEHQCDLCHENCYLSSRSLSGSNNYIVILLKEWLPVDTLGAVKWL